VSASPVARSRLLHDLVFVESVADIPIASLVHRVTGCRRSSDGKGSRGGEAFHRGSGHRAPEPVVTGCRTGSIAARGADGRGSARALSTRHARYVVAAAPSTRTYWADRRLPRDVRDLYEPHAGKRLPHCQNGRSLLLRATLRRTSRTVALDALGRHVRARQPSPGTWHRWRDVMRLAQRSCTERAC